MAAAVQVSKLRWRYVDQSEAPLTMTEALYLATVGGGEFWQDFGEQVGLFEPGYAFDALVLDDSHLRSLRSFTPAERLERYAYLGKGALSAKVCPGQKVILIYTKSPHAPHCAWGLTLSLYIYMQKKLS